MRNVALPSGQSRSDHSDILHSRVTDRKSASPLNPSISVQPPKQFLVGFPVNKLSIGRTRMFNQHGHRMTNHGQKGKDQYPIETGTFHVVYKTADIEYHRIDQFRLN